MFWLSCCIAVIATVAFSYSIYKNPNASAATALATGALGIAYKCK